MAVVNLVSQFILHDGILRENGTNAYRPKPNQDTVLKACLEEEIRTLRSRMEQAAIKENSFTSEMVIGISMLLDEKINEYNEYMRNHKET
jgi:hypothetical protein